ncbi:multiple antibiotic resistance transcriptional regulator [Escherichia coli]|nr:multiple antibiotic resistance transcriptional regulator [Escherichia coli]
MGGGRWGGVRGREVGVGRGGDGGRRVEGGQGSMVDGGEGGGVGGQQAVTRNYKNYVGVPPHKDRMTKMQGESGFLHPLNHYNS